MNKMNDISDETTCSFYINNKLKTRKREIHLFRHVMSNY